MKDILLVFKLKFLKINKYNQLWLYIIFILMMILSLKKNWTLCKGSHLPLDPVDGLIIQGQDNLYPWQEPEYVSVDAALWRRNIDDWISVADVEKERYDELKVIYSRKKQ